MKVEACAHAVMMQIQMQRSYIFTETRYFDSSVNTSSSSLRAFWHVPIVGPTPPPPIKFFARQHPTRHRGVFPISRKKIWTADNLWHVKKNGIYALICLILFKIIYSKYYMFDKTINVIEKSMLKGFSCKYFLPPF